MGSRFDSDFARVAAPVIADWHGAPIDAITFTELNDTETKLSHVVVSDERRKWAKGAYGWHLTLERDGWIISDPNRANYSGATALQIGGSLTIDSKIYTIDAVNPGEHIVEFHCVRQADVEVSSPDFRGR